MDDIIAAGTNLVIIHDVGGGAEGEYYTAPTTPGAGIYRYVDRRDYPHIGESTSPIASNSSPSLVEDIYKWIINPSP